MKKSFFVTWLCLLTFYAKSQDLNFTSAYDKITWPVELGVQGGIIGDDGTYKKLTLFHGNQISFLTGTNTPNNAFTRMVINSLGNVGIGTSEPGDKLTVQDAIRVAVSGNGGFYAADAANGGNSIFSLTRQGNNLSLSAWDGIGFSTNAHAPSTSYNMFIRPDGNIGIGTTDTKGYKFAVAGGVIAEQVTVKLQANWPDYVFKPNYNLLTLSDLKIYLDRNRHLPEMPSAQEVAKDGLNLGEMVRLQTKKIEELTLYLIEKDKQLTQQQAVNQEQQKMIEQLNARMMALEKASTENKAIY